MADSQAGYEHLYREVCAERTKLKEQLENWQRSYELCLAERDGLKEQFETFLDAAWKFEQEMANGEFVHFGEFRCALVAASGTDRASNPAMCRHTRTTERPRYAVDDEPGHYLCLDCGDKFPLIGDTDKWEPRAISYQERDPAKERP